LRLVHGHDRQIVVSAVCQVNGFDTFRQGQVGDVNDLAGLYFRQVHFDELRQVARQTADVQLGQVVGDAATLHFHADASVFVNEVQWNPGVQLLRAGNAHEVRVQDQLLRRMALKVLDDHVLGFAIHVQLDDA